MESQVRYWIDGKFRAAMRFYIVLFPVVLVLGTLISLSISSPIVFLALGVIPASILVTIRVRHSPAREIESFVMNEDPELHEQIAVKVGMLKEERRHAQVLAALLGGEASLGGGDLRAFVRNFKYVNMMAMCGAVVWFLTFIALVFLVP